MEVLRSEFNIFGRKFFDKKDFSTTPNLGGAATAFFARTPMKSTNEWQEI